VDLKRRMGEYRRCCRGCGDEESVRDIEYSVVEDLESLVEDQESGQRCCFGVHRVLNSACSGASSGR
jgi:hypothetical protein